MNSILLKHHLAVEKYVCSRDLRREVVIGTVSDTHPQNFHFCLVSFRGLKFIFFRKIQNFFGSPGLVPIEKDPPECSASPGNPENLPPEADLWAENRDLTILLSARPGRALRISDNFYLFHGWHRQELHSKCLSILQKQNLQKFCTAGEIWGDRRKNKK